MEFLIAEYTEVWITSAVVPLIQFASRVHPISSTGLDLLGVGDIAVPPALEERLGSFDDIVTWYGTARPEFRSALCALNANCTFLAALPPVGYRGHAVDFFAQQVGAPAGLAPRIPVEPIERYERIVIHPFSGSARKNWPLPHFRQLAHMLRLPVDWIAGPEEECEGARRFESLYGLAQWLAGARLYIGNDSGITHLAAALGVPTLVLFGPTDPALWAPRGARVIHSDPLSSLGPAAVLEQALIALTP